MLVTRRLNGKVLHISHLLVLRIQASENCGHGVQASPQ